MKVVRSIDLGFGFTKFTVGVNKDGVPKMASFPSIVSTVYDYQMIAEKG
jgi:hypothetical protein